MNVFLGIATGWGAVKEHGQVSNKLQEVRVPILSNVDCKKTGYKNRITDNMLCAGYPKGQKDSCQVSSARYQLLLIILKNILLKEK